MTSLYSVYMYAHFLLRTRLKQLMTTLKGAKSAFDEKSRWTSSSLASSQSRLYKNWLGPRAVIAFFGCFLFLTLFRSDKSTHNQHQPLTSLNRTAGFQKIFVISLPDRDKKRDVMSLMAHASNLRIEFQDGISLDKSMTAEQKKLLYPINSTSIPVEKLGSFRSHANVWRKIVNEDISTALILEDDADWDVEIHAQLRNSQTSLKEVVEMMGESDTVMRHMDGAWPSTGWDIIRFGFCEDKRYIDGTYQGLKIDEIPSSIYHDVNVPFSDQCYDRQTDIMQDFGAPLRSSESDPTYTKGHSGQRLVVPSIAPVCLHAYAVTKEGAAKMLYYQNKVRLFIANDLGIASATENGFLKSFTVVPTLFTQFKTFGESRNSDMYPDSTGSGIETMFAGVHPCVVESSRSSLTKRYPGAW